MSMYIDESGGQPAALCIYDLGIFGNFYITADSGDLAVFDQNGAVLDGAVCDCYYLCVDNSYHVRFLLLKSIILRLSYNIMAKLSTKIIDIRQKIMYDRHIRVCSIV